MYKIFRLAIVIAFMFNPAFAQTNETYSAYVLSLPTVGALVGNERMYALQGGTSKATSPQQILGMLNGDCSFVSSIVCVKTNGVAFAPSATTDATNASNISSGTLAAARGGAGTINGALKGNGSGTVSQAACADLSNAASSCSVDATSATNISSGTLGAARLPSPFTSGTASGSTSQFATVAAGTKTSTHVATWDASGNIQDGGAAGTGTVTENKNTFGNGLTSSGNCDNTTTNLSTPCNAAVSLSALTNVLAANVSLNAVGTYFDGPSVAQGNTGTWLATGQVTVSDTAGLSTIQCKLWDGTNIIASTYVDVPGASYPMDISLSGYNTFTLTGNIRISCKDSSSTNGVIFSNATGLGKDSVITAIRIQ